MFGTDRSALRRIFAESWRKALNKKPMEALEQQIASVIAEHPEYHPLIEAADDLPGYEFTPENGSNNPFLHLGMHLALREQLATGRPEAIRKVWPSLLKRMGDAHLVEHCMMECLGQALWEAQRNNRVPDEAAYIECLQRLA